MDRKVREQLEKISLANVTLFDLSEIESDHLLSVKGGRSRGEYCWTLTPFLPSFVLQKDASVERITYLDADIYFFRPPDPIFHEFSASGAHVLITEHAYDPRYDKTESAGRFCVQFVTFRNTQKAHEVLRWWQERCLEWCFAVPEDGKFGDQKYLDQWPDLFGAAVHILLDKRLALAPWNADYYLENNSASATVFFHFHGLRLISADRVRLFVGYRIGKAGMALYRAYLKAMRRAQEEMDRRGFPIPYFAEARGILPRMRDLRLLVTGRTQIERLQ
jgi:hypothetical protein